MRKTKIVCTLGPATDDPDVLRTMIVSGLDVARLNFSHGDHEGHKTRIENVRRVCGETGCTVALLADTKGPEIRLDVFQGGSVKLVAGSIFTLTVNTVAGDA